MYLLTLASVAHIHGVSNTYHRPLVLSCTVIIIVIVARAQNSKSFAPRVFFLNVLQRQFDVTKEDLRSLNPSASAKLLWGLAKTEAAFAEGFDRECLEAVAADMGPKLLSFSPRVSSSSSFF